MLRLSKACFDLACILYLFFRSSACQEKKIVWIHFQMAKNDKNANIVYCKYCNKSYAFPNATRMEKHLEVCNKYVSSFVNKEGKEDLGLHLELHLILYLRS